MTTRLLLCISLLLAPVQGSAQVAAEEAQAWRAACAELPQLAEFVPLFLKPSPFEQLMAWVPEGETVRVYDETCKPIDVIRHEGHLAGDVEVKTAYHKGVKKVSARTAHFGLDVSYTGPGWTEYTKDASGAWREAGGGGMGCLQVRPGALSRVTADSAFYDGAVVTLKVVCSTSFEETGTCRDGRPRRCKRCTDLQVQAKPESPGVGMAYAIGPQLRASASKALDCAKPCPPDELSPRAERLNSYLEGKRFVLLGGAGSGAALFRSLKACRKWRRSGNGGH